MDGNIAFDYKFVAPYFGIIAGVKLIHNSGGITCKTSEALTNWGCGDVLQTNLIKVSLDETSSSNGLLLYPTTDTYDVYDLGIGTCNNGKNNTFSGDIE